MLGIFNVDYALNKAYEQNLDLVLISPTANPPVAKIMDYKKYRYDQIKKDKEERRKQAQASVQLRDIWLSATIDVGDLKTKAKKGREFIENGDKVRASIRMRGRQLAHPEAGFEVMNDFFDILSDIAEIESAPVQQGRSIYMVLAPISTKQKNKIIYYKENNYGKTKVTQCI
jgi:translation initiation factor IF-3